MLAQPSMIKRAVLDLGGKLLVGFKAKPRDLLILSLLPQHGITR
jgi:hypothetical protein